MIKAANIMLAGPAAYTEAVSVLKAGGLVALPTETVYGLAVDARNEDAIARLYAAKGRPAHNPLIAHIFDPAEAKEWAKISPLAQRLMDIFWPGPLTLVLPRKAGRNLSALAGAGLPTLALRCPEARWAQAFTAQGLQGPLFMPSANISGRISPTAAQHVAEDLGDKVDLIIDGGPCLGGVESTVLAIEGETATLLRPGTIPAEAFAPHISSLNLPEKAAKPSAPGMLASHYAPRAKVRLNALEKRKGEAYLAFGPSNFADAQLSLTRDIEEAARNLYAMLRELDNIPVKAIAVAPIPEDGLGQAINDRLRRAAAERP